jgi:hypothetical protein
MSLPEGYLPREGDILMIAGTVEHDVTSSSAYIFVNTDGASSTIALNTHKPLPNVTLKRRTWREGEMVVHKAIERFYGEVVAMAGDHVVVKIGDGADKRRSTGGLRIFHCNELEPKPEKTFDCAGADVRMEPAPAPPYQRPMPMIEMERPATDAEKGEIEF